MPNSTDLTILQNVKYWLQGNGINDVWNTNSDVAFGIYIGQATRAILTYLQRPNILPASYTEKRDGIGGSKLILKNFPVTSITQLVIDNLIVPARPALTGSNQVTSTFPFGPVGYDFEPWDGTPPGGPQELITVGFPFNRGRLNVQITYKAGYQTTETLTIPDTPGPYTITPAQAMGRWAVDLGVTFSDGTALTKIASGTPSTGQYLAPPALPASVADPSASWAAVYTFAAADKLKDVNISYGYIPADIDYCACKWVGEVFSYKARIAQKSKILPQNQGTATFDLSDMPADMKLILNNYRRVIPL